MSVCLSASFVDVLVCLFTVCLLVQQMKEDSKK